MKISIVIPSNNEAEYVNEIIDFVTLHSKPENIEEIIIVESFYSNRIVKVAEKSHAALYYNVPGTSTSQLEIGSFQAKGEVIYFIKPGCIPPIGFDEKIIKFVQEKYELGCFDFDIKTNDTLITRIYKRIISVLPKKHFQVNSFFVLRKYYYQSGGLQKHKNYFNLTKTLKLNSNK